MGRLNTAILALLGNIAVLILIGLWTKYLFSQGKLLSFNEIIYYFIIPISCLIFGIFMGLRWRIVGLLGSALVTLTLYVVTQFIWALPVEIFVLVMICALPSALGVFCGAFLGERRRIEAARIAAEAELEARQKNKLAKRAQA